METVLETVLFFWYNMRVGKIKSIYNMKKYLQLLISVSLVALLAAPVLAQNEAKEKTRQEKVKEATSEIMKAANRVSMGAKVQELVKDQEEELDKAEKDILIVQSRNRIAKLIAGPNYGRMVSAQNMVKRYANRLEQMKSMLENITNADVKAKIEVQIANMEQVKAEFETKLAEAEKGFSLFGWFNKLRTRSQVEK